MTLADYLESEETQIAETKLYGWRLVVRRTRLVDKQADLFPNWQYFAFATNRTEPLLLIEAEHREHAVVDLAIRDLKDQPLAHFPSAHYAANNACTVIAALAHNLTLHQPDTCPTTTPAPPPPAATDSSKSPTT